MSDNRMPTRLELELAELGRIRDENYSDLLDQMDEAWGQGAFEVGSAEVRAFLESRIVHRPTKRLRADRNALLAAAKKVITGLDVRIEHAKQNGETIPLFDGIGDLHDAIRGR